MNIVKSLVEGYAKINTATRFAKLVILTKVTILVQDGRH